MFHACLKKYCYFQEKKKKLKSTKCLLCIFLPLSLLLSALPSLHRSLSSINDRTGETCASSNVWLYFSFCWQSKGSEWDNSATLLHLAWCCTYLQPQKKLNLWKTTFYDTLTVAVEQQHTPLFTCCSCKSVDNIRSGTTWNKESYECVCVCMRECVCIRGWSVMDCLPANRLFVNFVNVAVRCMFVRMSVLLRLWACVYVSLQTSGWYLVSGVSAVDI